MNFPLALQPFAFAGIWDHWEGQGQIIESCAIIVTVANELIAPIHERMPVIIPPGNYAAWLDPALHDPERLKTFLRPGDVLDRLEEAPQHWPDARGGMLEEIA